MNGQSGRATRRDLARYKRMQDEGNLVIFGPLYSYYDLWNEAINLNPATAVLPAGNYSFFSAGIGQQGQGQPRAMTICETNLEGKGGALPGGFDFVMQSCGIITPSTIPNAVKIQLDRFAAVVFERHEIRWRMGKIALWPSGEFHTQAKSVATTVAGTLIDYSVNGAVQQRWFPPDGELLFPRNQIIQFDLVTCHDMFITDDGLTLNEGQNDLDDDVGCQVGLSGEGFKFSLVAP